MHRHLHDSRCEEEAARLLPWYVTGRLSVSDTERVARHLERCAICRNDLTDDRALRTLLRSDSSLEYAPQPGLARTLSRIDELERETPAAAPSPVRHAPMRAHRFGPVHWLAAAALVQAIALGAMGTSMFHRSMQTESRYTTMSSAPVAVAPGSRIRVVFSPAMSLGALQSLLAQNALTVVHGPSDAGAYTLAFTDSRSATQRLGPAIAALRRDARVMFAEPAVIDEGGGW